MATEPRNVRLIKNDRGFTVSYELKRQAPMLGDSNTFNDAGWDYPNESFGENEAQAAFDRFLDVAGVKKEYIKADAE